MILITSLASFPCNGYSQQSDNKESEVRDGAYRAMTPAYVPNDLNAMYSRVLEKLLKDISKAPSSVKTCLATSQNKHGNVLVGIASFGDSDVLPPKAGIFDLNYFIITDDNFPQSLEERDCYIRLQPVNVNGPLISIQFEYRSVHGKRTDYMESWLIDFTYDEKTKEWKIVWPYQE